MASDNLPPVVRRLVDPSAEEIERIVNVLLRVFDGDIAMESLSGRDKSTQRLIYRLTIQQAVESGECLVARSSQNASEICGVAAWVAPGIDWDFHADPAFLAALDPSLREWYSAHYALKYIDLRNCSDIPMHENGAWDLKLLAVIPEARRRGVGKALVDVICKRADSNHEPMLADVRDPSIVHFFQQSGFKYRCVKNIMCPGSPGFPIWRMSRDPSGAPAPGAHTMPPFNAL